MNKEKYNQIISDTFKNYISKTNEFKGDWPDTMEDFITKCKTNPEFSEKWGLKIEERELSEKERIIFAGYDYENGGGIGWNMIRETVDMDNSIPRKLITLTYNNETIESYE